VTHTFGWRRSAACLGDPVTVDACSAPSRYVEAMSLYKHVRDKAALLDGIVEAVLAELDLPSVSIGSSPRSEAPSRAIAARPTDSEGMGRPIRQGLCLQVGVVRGLGRARGG